MHAPLYDDIWTRRGISILWDAEALDKVCTPQQVVSLRRFLELRTAGWPDGKVPLVGDKVLVVAGLESAIDALPPDQACHWLEQVVYKSVVSYQQEIAGGGSEAALVLWIAENRRIAYQTSDDTYSWHCATEYKGQQLPLGQCLFNGAQQDLRQIHTMNGKTEHWIGLYHPRIS